MTGPGADRCPACDAALRPLTRYCAACGRPVEAPAARPRARWPLAAAVAVAALLGGTVAVLVVGRTAEPPPAPAPPTFALPVPAAATGVAPSATSVTATAPCVYPPSRERSGRAVSYEPAKAVDGDPTTAWRCRGDGGGQRLTLTFAQPVRITSVALVPGLAKTDPTDGTDRYAQNRRIESVRLDFGEGHVLTQHLVTDPSRRGPQTVEFETVVTRTVVITVLLSVPGTEQAGQAAVDSVAISEVVVG